MTCVLLLEASKTNVYVVLFFVMMLISSGFIQNINDHGLLGMF
jgi:hypothetical protein